MDLSKFIKQGKVSNDVLLEKLRKKLVFENGYSEIVALRKAETMVFKPEKLKNIRLKAEKNIGHRPSLEFFFDTEEDIKLVTGGRISL